MVCFLFLVLCLVSVLTLWLVCFFFNATATAKIDTYGHTLSLHDALPIYPATRRQCSVAYLLRKYVRARANPAHSRSCRRNGHWVTQQQSPRLHRTKRSDEHTSELQSLMSISSAVYCLKTQQARTARTNSPPTHPSTPHPTRTIPSP